MKENQKKYQDFKRTIDRRRRQLSEALKGARKSKNKVKEAQLVKEIKELADRLKKARNYVETFKKNKNGFLKILGLKMCTVVEFNRTLPHGGNPYVQN